MLLQPLEVLPKSHNGAFTVALDWIYVIYPAALQRYKSLKSCNLHHAHAQPAQWLRHAGGGQEMDRADMIENASMCYEGQRST